MNQVVLISILATIFLPLINCGPLAIRSQPKSFNCSSWKNQFDEATSKAFLVSNRNFTFPTTIAEVDKLCSDVFVQVERVQEIARSCLKPFPKQIVGIFIRGVKKQFKKVCNNRKEKEKVFKYADCLRPEQVLTKIFNISDEFTKVYEYINTNSSVEKRIPLACCYYQDYKEVKLFVFSFQNDSN